MPHHQNEKSSALTKKKYDTEKNALDFHQKIQSAKEQLLFFSGNLTFLELRSREKTISYIDRKLFEGINIFIITRIGQDNARQIRELLNLNNRGHRGTIGIRYAQQPLRCSVIDAKECHFKEYHEKNILIHTITDEEWIRWVSNVFWQLWHGSIDAEKRMLAINQIVQS